MFRPAFDPSVTVIAASPFMAGGRTFRAGEVVDWRAVGVSESVLFDWWRTGLVTHPAPGTKVFKVTPGESVGVCTPAQQRREARPRGQR